mmetsp:Transcript_14890/g.37461  ORF Transcript_14890/g.37461 Transcript_14890/m.37461 type:complete len:302 (-) Transcript_14890:35-940(-)
MPQTLSRNCLGSSNSNSSSSKVATLLLLASCSSLVAAGGGSREGRCSGSGYMSVGWPGMSRDKCIERAAEVQKDTSQCSFLSYSSSLQPQQQSQFCLCVKDCSELTHPTAEVWETVNPKEAKAASDNSGSATIVIADSSAATEASSSLVAAGGGSREGRCSGSGYMNVGWSGMSRDKCIERAAEVQKDTSQCSFLSYSSSSQPQQQSQFCLCFKDCSELTHPSAEVWETVNPAEAKATSDASSRTAVVIAVIAGAAGLLVATTAIVCYIRHHRGIRAATSLKDNTDGGTCDGSSDGTSDGI